MKSGRLTTLGRTYLLEGRLSQATSVESGETEEGSAVDSCLSALDSAEHHLCESVSLLRQAGDQTYRLRGLLHRAALWRAFGEGETRRGGDGEKEYFERAERDLSEAESIAERGSMLIWQIEAALERSRLFLTMHQVGWQSAEPDSGDVIDSGSPGASPSRRWIDQAQQKLDETRSLIKQTEKPYEPHVPDWSDWEPPEYVGVFKAAEIVGYHCRNDEIETLQRQLSE